MNWNPDPPPDPTSSSLQLRTLPTLYPDPDDTISVNELILVSLELIVYVNPEQLPIKDGLATLITSPAFQPLPCPPVENATAVTAPQPPIVTSI